MNLLLNLMSRSLIGQGLGLLSLFLIKSQLPSEDFGKYVVLVGILQLSSVPFGNPMHTYLVKVNQEKDNFSIHPFFIAMLLVVIFLVGISSLLTGLGMLVFVICVGLMSIFCITIFTGIKRANKEHIKALIFDNTVRPTLFFFFVTGLVIFEVEFNYQKIFIFYVAVIVLCAVFALMILKNSKNNIIISRIEEFSEYWAILLMRGSALFYPNLVILILGYHQHFTFLGNFRIIERLSKLVSLGQNSGNYIFANVFTSVDSLTNEIKKTQYQSTLIGALIFSLITGTIFFSSELSLLLSLSVLDLSSSLSIFIILGIGQIINCYFAPFGTALIFLNKADIIMRIQFCLIILSLFSINLLLNFFQPDLVVYLITGYFLILNLSRKFVFDRSFTQ